MLLYKHQLLYDTYIYINENIQIWKNTKYFKDDVLLFFFWPGLIVLVLKCGAISFIYIYIYIYIYN